MTAVQAMLLIVGSGALIVAMVGWMARMNARERQMMDRRRQEWLDNGSLHDDEPKFYSGHRVMAAPTSLRTARPETEFGSLKIITYV
jgi:hypothetical protein